MSGLIKLPVVLAASVLLAGTQVQAADFEDVAVTEEVVPAYQPPEQSMVEFGTGWYLRGDLAVSSNDVNAALSATNWSGNRNLGVAASVGIGGGYQLNKHVRFEAGIERYFGLQTGEQTAIGCGTWDHDGDDYAGVTDVVSPTTGLVVATANRAISGTCAATGRVELAATTFMVSAYVDLFEIFGLTPYLGGSVGTALMDWSTFTVSTACTGEFGPDCRNNGRGTTTLTTDNYNADSEWRLAYALAGGLSYKVSKNMSLDAGYRWTRIAGGPFTDYARASNISQPHSFSTSALNIHQVKVGLRYAIW